MDKELRKKRHNRLRSRVHGTSERPRASVFRGNKHIVVQLIDDVTGTTVLSASNKGEKGTKVDQAQAVGKNLAEAAKKKGITAIVFDRGGYKYHGRVKAVADAMREAGLQF